jgi:hypothetical protein
LKVVSNSLRRQGLDRFWQVQYVESESNLGAFKIIPVADSLPVSPIDVIFLIPTCARYAAKADAVRRTWASELASLGYRYLFLMGNPQLQNSVILEDVLHVPCRDDYESLLLKLVLGYQFLYSIANFTHIYKIDDDCYPDLTRITSSVLPQLSSIQYAGGKTHPKGANINKKWHFGKCSDVRFDKVYHFDAAPFEYAKGGYGYFLRRDVLPVLFENVELLKKEIDDYVYSYEDIRIAEMLHQVGVTVNKLNAYYVRRFSEASKLDFTLIYDILDTNKYFILQSMLHHERTVVNITRRIQPANE